MRAASERAAVPPALRGGANRLFQLLRCAPQASSARTHPGPRWLAEVRCADMCICPQQGRYKATWKREFKLPWLEAGDLIPLCGLVVRLSSTSPQRGGKCCFSTASMCTTCLRIPASASANPGPEKGDLMGWWCDAGRGKELWLVGCHLRARNDARV